jgi:crotonobetainyl-CoA:carnitine CoA-transferase CaiB-like acyl-CoA transferase
MTTPTGPLQGIRVIEVAQWVFVPSASAILADLGADVVRIEHPVQGDPYAALTTSGSTNTSDAMAARSAQANRGKRSVGVDLSRPEGREIVYGLLQQADVFLTSLRKPALARFGLSEKDVAAVNPDVVYARGDAFGSAGAESDKPGYDITAFWARGGVGTMVTPPGTARLAQQPPSFGDRIASLGLALGVLGSLLGRHRGGEAQPVSASLLGTAAWVAASQVVSDDPRANEGRPPLLPPLAGAYACADGRWIMLNLMQATRYWEDFCAVTGSHRLTDPRFADDSGRVAHQAELRAVLEDAFRAHTRDEWAAILADFEGPWAPVQEVWELATDPQVVANGIIRDVPEAPGLRLVQAPVTVGQPREVLPRGPELGEHTEVVLLEAGIDWEAIEKLKADGVIT